MARIGHASPRAALIYQHATAERDRTVADFLDAEIEAAKQAPKPTVPSIDPTARGAAMGFDK
jgi:hypothetical protein